MQKGLIKKNTYFIALSYGGQLFMAFILTLVATKKLGTADFGIYMFASIMGYFLFLMNDLGLVTYVVREVSKQRDKAEDYFKNALILKWILLGFTVPVLILYIRFSGFEDKKLWSVLAFFVFGFFFFINTAVLCHVPGA